MCVLRSMVQLPIPSCCALPASLLPPWPPYPTHPPPLHTTSTHRYSFPRLHLPPKAIAAAKAAGKTPDTYYCLQARLGG